MAAQRSSSKRREPAQPERLREPRVHRTRAAASLLTGVWFLLAACVSESTLRSAASQTDEPLPGSGETAVARIERARSDAGADHRSSEPPSTASNSRVERDPQREPLSASDAAGHHAAGELTRLSLDELPAPLLWRPPASRSPRPLIVSAHGAGGTPEWHCEWLRRAVEDRAYVLCLRGRAMVRGTHAYYYPEHHTLERLMLSGLEAVDASLPPQALQPGAGVYVGYSQGATMGALMILAHAQRFPHLLLIEGGHAHWTAPRSRQFAANGGQRVYFACGQASCQRGAERASERLKQAGVQARVGYAPGAGHTPAGEVGELAVEGLLWLLANR